ncbi:MAG: DNA polymerase III subunit beta [Gammaproteobacteria bacterium]|nr:DNA polymerase III subunit beta [Gammaproteobacteria bacterium]
MKLNITREQLLSPLQNVIGAVEKRQTMPILSNVLMRLEKGVLSITGTDLEIELVAQINIMGEKDGETTAPARKLLDICKNLPEGTELILDAAEDRLTVKAGRSRFVLATLPAGEFPSLEDIRLDSQLSVAQKSLKQLIEKTAFAMAQQDVRYYLNGLMLENADGLLRAVATDGHRLAMAEAVNEQSLPSNKQVIVPRKGIMELQRLLQDKDEPVTLGFSSNHVRVEFGDLRFTSKLIDGRFPDYERVMPQGSDKLLVANRLKLKQSLTLTAILSNEKYKGVRLVLESGLLKIQTHNPDKEEAEEQVEVDYDGESLEIGFNVNYLLDVLNVLVTDNVNILLKDANSSCLIQDPTNEHGRYVIMPMRL